jgi:hypothetical protein
MRTAPALRRFQIPSRRCCLAALSSETCKEDGIAIGAIAIVVLVMLIVMATRGGGTTIVSPRECFAEQSSSAHEYLLPDFA